MTEHIATVIVAAVLWDVLTRIVTHIQTTVPEWLTTALMGLLAASVCVVGIALLAVALFVVGLVDAIEHERNEHAKQSTP